MTVFQLVGIALGGTITAMFVKQLNQTYALYVSLFTTVILFFYSLKYFEPMVSYAMELSDLSGISPYASVMLRVTGIGIVCNTAYDICTDAGESAIGAKIELAGKGAIALCVLPVLKNIIEATQNFLM